MIRVQYPFRSTFLDYPDDESIAVSIYVCGCINNCKHCQNPELAVYKSPLGTLFDFEKLKKEIYKTCNKNQTNKVVFTGGDPIAPRNYKDIQRILNEMNDIFFMIYTGHDISYVKEIDLKNFQYIKCGKFEKSLEQISEKTDKYIQFASKNQKLYNNNLELISNNGRYYF